MNILAGLYRPDAGESRGRRARRVRLAAGRDRGRHRHGPPALHAGPLADRHRERPPRPGPAALPARPARGRGRGRAGSRRSSACGSTRGPRSGSSRSASSSGSRSSRCSTAGRAILIMDEPTAVLAPQEIEELFATLRSMTAAGRSVVFISHKLGEVLAIADRITVMRRGSGDRAPGVPAAGRDPGRARPADGRAGRSSRSLERTPVRARARSCSSVSDVEAAQRPRPAGAARRVARRPRRRDRRHRRGRGQRPDASSPRSITGLRPLHAGAIRSTARTSPTGSPGDAIRRGVGARARRTAPGSAARPNLRSSTT